MMSYSSALHEFIEQWIKARNTTWEWLFKRAGVPRSVGTRIRQGGTPRPETLRRLAEAVGVSRRKLFELAGYVNAEDLEPTGLSEEEEQVLDLYRQLPRRDRLLLREVGQGFLRPIRSRNQAQEEWETDS